VSFGGGGVRRGTIETVRVVQILLILLVVGVTAAVALGWGDRLVSVPVDRAPAGLRPNADVSAEAIPELRFNLALRGYRMAEVDQVLTQLADALAARDERIAELESGSTDVGRLGGADIAIANLPAPGPDLIPPTPSSPAPPGPGRDPSPPAPEPPLDSIR
jgi:DivIVA domain-containing protein